MMTPETHNKFTESLRDMREVVSDLIELSDDLRRVGLLTPAERAHKIAKKLGKASKANDEAVSETIHALAAASEESSKTILAAALAGIEVQKATPHTHCGQCGAEIVDG